MQNFDSFEVPIQNTDEYKPNKNICYWYCHSKVKFNILP